MGEDAWLELKRREVRKARQKNPLPGRLQRQAWTAALRRLREAHRSEFDQYYREERHRRGLNP